MVSNNATTGGQVSFNLDNYVDVPTRLRMALEKFPDLRVQESQPVFREVEGKLYLEMHVKIWRDKDDQLPMVAYCWEPFPGRTPYTRDSEMMNLSTSLLGRGLGMMGFGIDHKMASKQEVLARQQPEVTEQPATYPDGGTVPDPFTGEAQTTNVVKFRDPKAKASDKQLGMIRALARTKGLATGQGVTEGVSKVLGRKITKLDELTKPDASKVIEAWKAAPTQDEAF
jgi:hypothetical protein